jgi:hypothetical protein
MYTRCSLCGEAEHTMMRCPDLTDPLRGGFSGAGGGGGGGHGEDDNLVQFSGNKFGLWCSDQRSGYTTGAISPNTAAHQLNELLEMTAPAPQLLITWSAMSSFGSSQSTTFSF